MVDRYDGHSHVVKLSSPRLSSTSAAGYVQDAHPANCSFFVAIALHLERKLVLDLQCPKTLNMIYISH